MFREQIQVRQEVLAVFILNRIDVSRKCNRKNKEEYSPCPIPSSSLQKKFMEESSRRKEIKEEYSEITGAAGSIAAATNAGHLVRHSGVSGRTIWSREKYESTCVYSTGSL